MTNKILELNVGDKVTFEKEHPAYKIMAVSKRYAIAVRPLTKKWDKDILAHKVKMGAYCTKEEVWEDLKQYPVYSIIDFEKNIRGSDNLVFGIYDYSTESGCLKVIIALLEGEIEISKRSSIQLFISKVVTKTSKP